MLWEYRTKPDEIAHANTRGFIVAIRALENKRGEGRVHLVLGWFCGSGVCLWAKVFGRDGGICGDACRNWDFLFSTKSRRAKTT